MNETQQSQKNIQYKMLMAANNYEAFREAAAEVDIEVLEFLLDRAGSPEEQYAMLAAYNHKMIYHITGSHASSSEEFKKNMS